MVQRRTVIRALRFSIIGLIVFTVAVFGVGTYTLVTGMVGVISSMNTFRVSMDVNNSTGEARMIFSATPRNTAFLGVNMFVNLGVLDEGGAYIAHNSTSVDVAPGGERPLTLVLVIPADVVQRYVLQGQNATATFEMVFGIRTLWGLVGISDVVRVQGGMNP